MTQKQLKHYVWLGLGMLIWSLKIREEQALFNLEIKKKSGSRNNLDIHYSKVPSSD